MSRGNEAVHSETGILLANPSVSPKAIPDRRLVGANGNEIAATPFAATAATTFDDIGISLNRVREEKASGTMIVSVEPSFASVARALFVIFNGNQACSKS